MKTLILMRHGKAEEALMEKPDVTRKLQAKGKQQISVMAQWLKEQTLIPDAVICSSATRTVETADGMTKHLEIPSTCIQQHDDLYLAPASVYIAHILTTNDAVNTLMLVGHNPGISELGMRLLPGFYEELPTAGILVLRSDATDWASWELYDTRFVTYQIPKRLL